MLANPHRLLFPSTVWIDVTHSRMGGSWLGVHTLLGLVAQPRGIDVAAAGGGKVYGTCNITEKGRGLTSTKQGRVYHVQKHVQ